MSIGGCGASRVPVQYATLPLNIQTVWSIVYYTNGLYISGQIDILRRILVMFLQGHLPVLISLFIIDFQQVGLCFNAVRKSFRALWRIARAVPSNSRLLLTSLQLLVSLFRKSFYTKWSCGFSVFTGVFPSPTG